MRRRLILAIVVVAGGAVLLFAIPLLFAVHSGYRDEELLRLQRDAVAATRQVDVGTGIGSADPIELPSSADVLAVYDRSGMRVAGRGPARADRAVAETLRTGRPGEESGGAELVASAPLVVGEQVTGVLRVARGDARVASRTRRAWLAFAGLAGLVLVAAGLAAAAIARWLARPLERIAGAARRLGQGDFSARTPPSGIPEVDAVGEVLDATALRLDGMLARERAFSADASHQLRTPLAALRIELEAIGLGEAPPPGLAAALAQVDRLQATIDTLLAVARDTPHAVRATPVDGLLDLVGEPWRRTLALAGRTLEVATPVPGLRADVSPDVAHEVLSVLLSNAYEHGAGTVTMTARRGPSGSIAIDVADEGEGLPEVPGTLFERRAGGGNGGHGIGLALARSLAEAEGGRLALSRACPPIFTLLLAEAENPGS